MRRIVEYTIVDHGVDHAQYFQGEGMSLSIWDEVATGAGENAKEAYEDAVEQLANSWNVDTLPKRPRGISTKSKVRRADIEGDDDMNEIHYYVSVKVKGEKDKRGGHMIAKSHPKDVRQRRHTAFVPRLRDVNVDVWEERDRLIITVTDTRRDNTVAQWVDDDARQMIDDGFFQRGGRLRASVLDYCVETGLVRA